MNRHNYHRLIVQRGPSDAIFVAILLDALAAMLYREMGW